MCLTHVSLLFSQIITNVVIVSGIHVCNGVLHSVALKAAPLELVKKSLQTKQMQV
jgi:hypothetical protein